MKSTLNIHWKDWGWSSNTLATWCRERTHWKGPRCWERLKVGGEGDDRGWDGWMASPTQWTRVWASSGRRWWTGNPGMLQSMGSQRVAHDWGAITIFCSRIGLNSAPRDRSWALVSKITRVLTTGLPGNSLDGHLKPFFIFLSSAFYFNFYILYKF